MRIIRPYGTSATEQDDATPDTLQRVLRYQAPDADALTSKAIEPFAKAHAPLLIAQWISAIDKIAAKPTGNNKPSREQRELRQQLGDAAWDHLVSNNLLPGLAEDTSLETLWTARLHPYPDGTNKKSQKLRGRWYKRFVGDAPPKQVDAKAVIRRIAEHLYERELPIHPDRPPRETGGRIAHRARSIARSVPSLARCTPRGRPDDAWEQAWRNYAAPGDLAATIRVEAQAIEAGAQAVTRDGARKKPARRWVGFDVAAAALYVHWQKVFVCPKTQRVLTVTEVKEDPAWALPFAIHEEVRGVYRSLLKRHGKVAKNTGGARVSEVARLLPQCMDDLKCMLLAKRTNRDVNALIRLGKVIHYEAAGDQSDRPAHVFDDWPDPERLAASRYWTSDGQAEIKANEAFVRVWRRVLALMLSTATDWAAPEGQRDVTGSHERDAAVGKGFCPDRHRRKVALLFGQHANLFQDGSAGEDRGRAVLRFLLETLSTLRNNSFHFVGLGGFRTALAPAAESDAADPVLDKARAAADPTLAKAHAKAHANARAAAQKLWRQDQEGRAARLSQRLQAAHVATYLTSDQLRTLWRTLTGQSADAAPDRIPLPRFKRVLLRAEHIRSKQDRGSRLPDPANRRDLEDPARLCQYTALKLVYDGPFRRWVTTADRRLNGYVRAAFRRSTEAAQHIHGKDPTRGALVVSKAQKLADKLGLSGSGIGAADFVAMLMRETAGEMRVQQGYESNRDNARDQAEFVQDLLRDVVARALLDYLDQAGLAFLLHVSAKRTIDETRRLDPSKLEAPPVQEQVEPWQEALYFAIHLAPVDDVAALLHQFDKFAVLMPRRAGSAAADRRHTDLAADVRRVAEVLELYLDMHDAKFQGGSAVAGLDAFAEFYASRELFDEVVARPAQAGDDTRVPTRGLREIARYGHVPILRPLVEQANARVTADEVREWRDFEREVDGTSRVAASQARRQELHDAWAKKKSTFLDSSVPEYVEILRDVIKHRRLANHVTLNTHVRLHRLIMQVLGRFVDYSGLFERDLYFAALALAHHRGLTDKNAFNKKAGSRLKQGRILDAIKSLETSIRTELERLFAINGSSRQLRNNFAHFNMLRRGRQQDQGQRLSLTRELNDCRTLMAYDRKLKNAVSLSVKELLQREGLDIRWHCDSGHELGSAKITSRMAEHLGGRRIGLPGRNQSNRDESERIPIAEALHGQQFVTMAALAFGGTAQSPMHDVCDLDLDTIDWTQPQSRSKR